MMFLPVILVRTSQKPNPILNGHSIHALIMQPEFPYASCQNPLFKVVCSLSSAPEISTGHFLHQRTLRSDQIIR